MTTQIRTDRQTRARIRALSQGVRVWVLEEGRRYVASSTSDDGIAYELSVRDGDITCTCKGAIHGRVSKHMGAVALRLIAEKQRIQADIDSLYGPKRSSNEVTVRVQYSRESRVRSRRPWILSP